MEVLTSDYAKDICKLGKREETCSYLVVGPGGFECAKNSSLHNVILARRKSGAMNAMGDNCEGC